MNFTTRFITILYLAALAGCGEVHQPDLEARPFSESDVLRYATPDDVDPFVDLEVSHLLPPTDLHPYWRDVIGEVKTIELYVDGVPRWKWDGVQWQWQETTAEVATSHDFEHSTAEASITRGQLAGIYRRLVELEKRAGIRDAEGEKVEAGNILIGDPWANPKSLPEIDREYRESQEPPHHEQ